MNERLRLVGALGVLLSSICACADEAAIDEVATYSAALTQAEYAPLAAYWAPRIYQDTADAYYRGDYITKFNFDGDYNGKNNWQNLDAFATVPAFVYYAVVESTTHYFIHYAFFHPRDWHEYNTLDMHENDLEGILLAVKKTGGTGTLVAMETLAHDQFYQYAAEAGITTGSDNVDGNVTLEGASHPRVFVEAKGHGVFACDERCDSAPGGDGIVYYEGGVADSPANGDGNFTRLYRYQLIAMDATSGDQGLWARRYDICDTCTFGAWGKLRGDDYGTDKAKLAWAWDDADDGQVFAGDMLCDPALFFDAHLNGTPFDSGFSHSYVAHPYRTHTIDILALRSDANRDPFGGASDIFAKVTVPDSPAGANDVLDARAYKKDGASVGTWYSFWYGAYQAEGQTSWGATFGSHSFCRPNTPIVTVAVYDSDSTSGGDFMGSIGVSTTVDYSAGVDLGDARVQFRLTKY